MSPRSTLSTNLLDELQAALAHGNVARRVETLRKVTDLFVDHSVEYSAEQIAVFDDVFQCLIEQLEGCAKTLLAERLGPVAGAPPQVIRTLAFDDLIEVAAPVLSQSDQLDENSLIENARTKSQGHLLAISTRKVLSGAVTDILVERGNDDVVKSTVNNQGAAFSEQGYTRLVQRADGNDEIATCVALRPSIPRHHLLNLIARASSSVRTRLATANPKLAAEVSLAVQQATTRARSARATMSEEAIISHELVRLLFKDGRLDENEVLKFALNKKFDEANAAIACLAHIPVSVAETMMVESSNEGILILSKVANFSWETVKAIINMREALSGLPISDSATDRDTYERLRPSTAQQVLRFHRMQQATSSPPAA
ncbi:DUF2336 domain-containing protein [Tardiphaga alba]|uniref:DUF2336 domain-containing protein n=1 Tax=Tardiphaga alba TaxID=340268 RepID=A0ABX8A9X5_9BRAD|nr:DUF2336 domain-containing protein [Tardiphaga alba]QUS39228.1 DUF2336 domain-containing protein [Tardiphaga alba]